MQIEIIVAIIGAVAVVGAAIIGVIAPRRKKDRNESVKGSNYSQTVQGNNNYQHQDNSINIKWSGCIYGGFPSLEKCDGAFGHGCKYQWSCPIYRQYLNNLPDIEIRGEKTHSLIHSIKGYLLLVCPNIMTLRKIHKVSVSIGQKKEMFDELISFYKKDNVLFDDFSEVEIGEAMRLRLQGDTFKITAINIVLFRYGIH